jgi:hypothetical protein
MSFKDLSNMNASKHQDTPEQARARAEAAVEAKTKHDAKSAAKAAHRQSKGTHDDAPRRPPDSKGGGATRS